MWSLQLVGMVIQKMIKANFRKLGGESEHGQRKNTLRSGVEWNHLFKLFKRDGNPEHSFSFWSDSHLTLNIT